MLLARGCSRTQAALPRYGTPYSHRTSHSSHLLALLPQPHPPRRFEPENAKMWFRKGKALSLKGDYEEAAEVLKQ